MQAEFPIVVNSDTISVGGLVANLNVEYDVGPAGKRGAIIFSGTGEPTSQSTVDPVYGTVNNFQPGDLYVRQDPPYKGWLYIYKELPGGSEWESLFSVFDNVVSFGSGSPEGSVTATVGNLYSDQTNGHLYIKASGIGQTGWIQLQTGTSGSGDVVGPGSATDNAVTRFDGVGGKTIQSSPVSISDAGTVTVPAAAGVAFDNGPKMLSGTGSPQYVVTAPVGSLYFDINATTGATHWRKATGAGNSGWVVMQGDTGWRKMAAWNAAGTLDGDGFWTAWYSGASVITNNGAGHLQMRRIHNTVHCRIAGLKTTAGAGSSVFFGLDAPTTPIPIGFRPTGYQFYPLYASTGSVNAAYSSAYSPGYPAIVASGAANLDGEVTWMTDNAWPTTLPGVAV